MEVTHTEERPRKSCLAEEEKLGIQSVPTAGKLRRQRNQAVKMGGAVKQQRSLHAKSLFAKSDKKWGRQRHVAAAANAPQKMSLLRTWGISVVCGEKQSCLLHVLRPWQRFDRQFVVYSRSSTETHYVNCAWLGSVFDGA